MPSLTVFAKFIYKQSLQSLHHFDLVWRWAFNLVK